MSLYGNVDSVPYVNVSATQGPFALKGGEYAVTVHASSWGGGSVTLQRLAADGTTYIPVMSAFTADGFNTQPLPPGTYQFAIAAATGVSVDVTSIVTSIQ